ncbi:hypothetical protein STsAS_109 [Salmonella phage STsAS]|nr:hypothetical protein STsAS_109 [Salmonella phage STsAS]
MPIRTILDGIAEELRRVGVRKLKFRQCDIPVSGKIFDNAVMDIYTRAGPRELCLWFVELAINHGEFYHPKMHRVMLCRVDFGILPNVIYNRLYRAMERAVSLRYEDHPKVSLIDHEGEAGVYFVAESDDCRDSKIFTRGREINGRLPDS